MVRVTCGGVVANTLFALSWVSWLFMLAGAGAMQSKCGGYFGKTIKIGGLDTFVEGCTTAENTSFIWWSVWFEFMVLVLLSVAQCFRVQGLMITKQLFLAMVSVVMMVAANHAVVAIGTWDGGLRVGGQVCLAGLIVSIFSSLVMMLVFGGEAGALLPHRKEVGEPQPNFAELARSEAFAAQPSTFAAPAPSSYNAGTSPNVFAGTALPYQTV